MKKKNLPNSTYLYSFSFCTFFAISGIYLILWRNLTINASTWDVPCSFIFSHSQPSCKRHREGYKDVCETIQAVGPLMGNMKIIGIKMNTENLSINIININISSHYNNRLQFKTLLNYQASCQKLKHIFSFNFHSDPIKIFIMAPFHRWKDWGSIELRHYT